MRTTTFDGGAKASQGSVYTIRRFDAYVDDRRDPRLVVVAHIYATGERKISVDVRPGGEMLSPEEARQLAALLIDAAKAGETLPVPPLAFQD
jgi:hypothetical protein